MKSIIKFFKRRYKILIPVMVALVLLVSLFFLYRRYEYDNTRNKKEIPVYQYFAGIRNEYTAIVTYNLKDSIVDVEPKDLKVELDSEPIYYMDKSKVIFPSEMNIAFPLLNGSQYKLHKYATYYKDNDVHFIKNNTTLGEYKFFFLYDGDDLFFFPDSVTLMIDNKEYIELGPMSYVSVVGGLTLIYYDTNTDKGEAIELDGSFVSVVGKHIEVDITRKNFISYNDTVLLFNPNMLDPVFKTIDK